MIGPGPAPYTGWGPPVLPIVAPPKKPPAGETDDGLPLAQRGRIGFDSASYLNTDGRDGVAALSLVATVPIYDGAFLEAILPFGWVIPVGNPSVGAHYVGKVADGLWLTGGGALGVPLLAEDELIMLSVPRAYWNVHHYYHDIWPVQARFGLEYHVEFFALRAQLQPSVWVPIGNAEDVHGSFQHALELQLGHEIGGGVRLQGVVIGPGEDNYQFAISPFFGLWKDLGFVRLGLMLPVDAELGPPFERSWGFLLDTGIHID